MCAKTLGLAKLSRGFDAVQLGHRQIHQNQVGMRAVRLQYFAVLGFQKDAGHLERTDRLNAACGGEKGRGVLARALERLAED